MQKREMSRKHRLLRLCPYGHCTQLLLVMPCLYTLYICVQLQPLVAKVGVLWTFVLGEYFVIAACSSFHV